MSSGREWGTLIGAAVGFFTGGAGYIALGATLGGAAGGLLDGPTKTEGPRIDDLKVSRSEYGQGIPLLYGTERISPNVIWSTDKIEISKTTSAGKGGGEENTSYRYYVQQRHLLCETPTNGDEVQIIRMFVDGKLQWDISSGISIGAALASAENPYAFIVMYQGGADQLPDPIEEVYEDGPGSVSAYRGVVSVRINGLECPGGRVPQISYVCSTNAEIVTTIDYGVEATIEPVSGFFQKVSYSRVALAKAPTIVFAEDGEDLGGIVPNKVIKVVPVGATYSGAIRRLDGLDLAYNYTAVRGIADIDALCVRDVPSSTYVDSKYNIVIDQNGETKRFFLDDIKVFGQSTSRWAKFGNRIAFSGDSNTGSLDAALYDYESGALLGRADGVAPLDMYMTRSYVWMIVSDGAGGRAIELHDLETFALVTTTDLPAGLDGGTVYFAPTLEDTLGAWVQGSGVSSLWSVAVDSFGTVSAVKIGEDLIGVVPTLSTTSIGVSAKTVSGITLTGVPGTYKASAFFINYGAAVTTAYKVSDVIVDQLERSGETRYDVSGIPDTDTIQGYKISSPASARANIDPLLTLINVYIVDEDGVIKVKKQEDIVSVASISYDELGFAEDGGDPGDPMPLQHTQAIDLPRSVSCSYIEPQFDYQTATEIATRQVTQSTEDVLIQLPIALGSSDQAKTVAERVMYARYLEQNKRTVKLSRKYAFVSPGDGEMIEYPRGTVSLWHVISQTDTGAGIEQTLLPGDAQLMSQVAVGATGYVSQQVSELPTPVQFQIVDGPIVRDVDNNAGPYVAMAGIGPNWPGGELFVGNDVTSVLPHGTVEDEAPQGFTDSPLGDWSLNIVDEANLLMVNVGHHELNSITRSVLLTGTQNLAAVGRNGRVEYLKFQRANDLGNGYYALSGLMRGMYGTEYNRGNHQSGDFFVLFDVEGMLRPSTSVGEIGLAKVYQGVTKGRDRLTTATTKNYANTGEGLKPYSPTNLVKDFDGNDITLDWVRRTRFSENWLNGIVPLGEVSERWQVVIYEDDTFATVVRTINTTTNSAVYTSAQQVADFGSNQTEISVRIAQISDVVGAGHELEETL